MNEKLHKKAYDESRKANPKLFNPNFSKHMEKVKGRDEARAKVAYEQRKMVMRSGG